MGPCCLHILCVKFASTNPKLPILPSHNSLFVRNHQFSSISMILFYRFVCVLFQIPRVSDSMWDLSLSDRLPSLTVIMSRPIYVTANGIISFYV